jgi:hypothetical protein
MWKAKGNTRISIYIDKEDTTKDSMRPEIRNQIINQEAIAPKRKITFLESKDDEKFPALL